MKSYLFEALLRLFYPSFCGICQKTLSLQEDILCAGCQDQMDSLALPMDRSFLEDTIEHLDHVWTAFIYESPFRELVRAVKYLRKDYFLKAVRRQFIALAQAVTAEFAYDALVPIPIGHRKYMARHFNQAEALAGILDPWVTPPVRAGLLRKVFHVPSQTSLNREEREINVYGAFRVTAPEKIRDRVFLLIDDVFTTGATAKEAARILKEAGAKRVDLLALACTSRISRAHLAPSSGSPSEKKEKDRGEKTEK